MNQLFAGVILLYFIGAEINECQRSKERKATCGYHNRIGIQGAKQHISDGQADVDGNSQVLGVEKKFVGFAHVEPPVVQGETDSLVVVLIKA
jgi:hypothetical protein